MKKKDKIENETNRVNNQANSQTKNILFLGFYIIFFMIIVILLRSGYKKGNNNITPYNSGYGHSFRLTNLEKENYNFTYIEEKNNLTTIYEGKSNKNIMKYQKSGIEAIEFIKNKDTTKYKNKNTLSWDICDSPITFEKFTNAGYIKNLLLRGTYMSRTTFVSSDDVEYNYEISTPTVKRIIDKEEVDIEDKPNKITVVLNKNKEIKEIRYDLTDYYKYLDNNILSYKLTLKFKNYGKVKEIELP